MARPREGWFGPFSDEVAWQRILDAFKQRPSGRGQPEFRIRHEDDGWWICCVTIWKKADDFWNAG